MSGAHRFKFVIGFAVFCAVFSLGLTTAQGEQSKALYWLKIKATSKYDRTKIESAGISIESVEDDYVVALGSKEQRDELQRRGLLITGFEITTEDFPGGDEAFHNYDELEAAIKKLVAEAPEIVSADSIGRSHEGRHLFHIRISTNQEQANQKPGIVFMGGHHAREHVSIEMPLMLAQFLVEQYKKGQPDIVRLVEDRDIHIIPMVNPDGAEYDISKGGYKMWRKNRRENHDGTSGVDLNRNYSYQWGTGGSSTNPSSDVYMGTEPFSEPETAAIRNFVEKQENLTILLSFHTFSELILYPWGYSYDPVANERDRKTFETMAKTMAKWNDYEPQAASDLYIASGDTVDWAYGTQKIFSFTFELDPKSIFQGGFYPGAKVIPGVFKKNLNPALYLIELADNPYRAIEPRSRWGLRTFDLQ